MDFYDTLVAADEAATEIGQARTVLAKAMEYFDLTDTEHRSQLAYNAEIISDLLCATNTLLYGIENELKETVRKAEETLKEARS